MKIRITIDVDDKTRRMIACDLGAHGRKATRQELAKKLLGGIDDGLSGTGGLETENEWAAYEKCTACHESSPQTEEERRRA